MKFHQKEENKLSANDKLLQITKIMATNDSTASNNMDVLQTLMSGGSTPELHNIASDELPELLYTASHDKTIQAWNTKVIT